MSRIHEALKRAEQENHKETLSSSSPVIDAVGRKAGGLSAALQTATLDDLPPDPEVTKAAFEGGELEAFLSTLPQREWNPDLKRMLFMDRDRHYDPGMEEFRSLRSRLYQLREKTDSLKTVMVASALPGEGKTFVSANLAQALVRQHGRRVLLIDADIRKPHMHESLGTIGTPGLIEYLSGEVDREAILQRAPMDNLFFIAGGKAVSNPSELIANGRFKKLIDDMKTAFHWIIVDSSPVIPVTDAPLIAPCCDGVVLVIQADGTPVELAKRARQEFKSVPVLGVVLNRTHDLPAESSYYYAYGRNGKSD